MKERRLIEYFGDLDDLESDKDIAFWKQLSTEERFTAAWEIIQDYYRGKGREDELRFRRFLETAGEI